MGFFKGIGKALGKVGKVALKLGAVGANVATGGLLDKAHSVAKTLGLTGGQRKQAAQMRVADQALATKLVPTVKKTEIVMQDQQSPVGVRKRNPVPVVRRRVNAMPGSGKVYQGVGATRTSTAPGSGLRRARRRKAAASNPVSVPAGTTSRKRSNGGVKRSLPPAMQARANRMKQMAADWRAAGKPGRWIDWVKANG
jgi:hypothetical protein